MPGPSKKPKTKTKPKQRARDDAEFVRVRDAEATRYAENMERLAKEGRAPEAVPLTAFQSLTLTVAVKLASLVDHVLEGSGEQGHELDVAAMASLADDAEVQGWLRTVPPELRVQKR